MYTGFTAEAVEAVLRDVVAERPNFVYEPPDDSPGDCKYVHGNAPGCLVGHVLHRMGVPLAELSAHEGESAGDVLRVLTDADEPAVNTLDTAQCVQDDGGYWSAALAEALT